MAPRKISSINNIVARLVTGKTAACAFCNRNVDDELLYGKLYAIGHIQCHYYCVLLSSCLIQKGKDQQGLFGFLFEDILIEIERCKKHKCSYCNQMGANMGCSVTQCRKQFHLPCGKEKNSVSLFYGNYKTFCQNHAPKQKIPESLLMKTRLRKKIDNKIKKECHFKDLKELSLNDSSTDTVLDAQSVCVICYEPVEGYPTANTFWPPCCARDAWFHRTCLQRMALSAGMHYLKCPLCNDKENFYEAVVSQGYYVPDRDAAWELEQNAFAEIYERTISCSATECLCPSGRSHDADTGAWSISICMLCGSSGQHTGCILEQSKVHVHICAICKPAAPEDLEDLANTLETVISQEQYQSSSRRRHGPVMPSRMSLRRTKQNIPTLMPCSSKKTLEIESDSQTINTQSSREDLNLKSPKKPTQDSVTTSSSLKFLSSPIKSEITEYRSPLKSRNNSKSESSPTKILEEGLKKKFGSDKVSVKEELLDELRKRFKKPQPLSVKKKIVNNILNGFFDNLLLEPKQKEPIKQWCSPKKCMDADEDVIEITQEPQDIVDLTDVQDTVIIEEKTQEILIKDDCLPEDHSFSAYTPNKLKTIDTLTDSSLEISAKDEIVNIDVFKVENIDGQIGKPKITSAKKKYGFKFNPCNKYGIDSKNIDIDMESFKSRYLTEVSSSKVIDKENSSRKRKLDKDKIIVELESKKRKKKRRTISIKNKNIQVRIKWRTEELKLQFNNIKRMKKSKKYNQYVLNYTPEAQMVKNKPDLMEKKPDLIDNKPVLGKPDKDFTPLKRKYIIQEKSPDNLVQTSIEKFFNRVSAPNHD